MQPVIDMFGYIFAVLLLVFVFIESMPVDWWGSRK
jgi:hypothetical protein